MASARGSQNESKNLPPSDRHWNEELEKWGECLFDLHFGNRPGVTVHHTDPPPPYGAGFVGQVAVNWKNIDLKMTETVGQILHVLCPKQPEKRSCLPCEPSALSVSEATGKLAEIAERARNIEAREAAQTQG